MSVGILTFAALLACLYTVFAYIFHPLFLSPLSRLPAAHWSCRISDFWILRARKHGVENASLQAAHRRYGEIVRVAPNTLSVDGVEATRTIYQGGFQKAPWYRIFDSYGTPCIFSTLDSKLHSRRKRMISNVYSKSFIQSSEAAKAQSQVIVFERLLPLLQQEAEQNPDSGTEVQSIFMAATMDFISAYIFGLQGSTNFLLDKTYRAHWLELYLSRHHHQFWPQELPLVTSVLTKIGMRLYPSFVDHANDELRAWNKDLCEKASKAYFSETPEAVPPQDKSVVFSALQQGIDKEEATEGDASILYDTSIRNRDAAVASEILDQALAGHETAGIVLTYAAWHLSQSPALQKELRSELLSLNPPVKTLLPSPKELDNLPVLNAVLMETLRLHAPIPGPQPRQTPYPGCHIAGFDIPGGVRVAALAHTLHRNEAVFPEPGLWDHARWLAPSDGKNDPNAMRRQFWAFGSGGRMCIGSNFALQEMKLVIATIYTNFTTSIVDDSGIEQTDGYAARPKADRLLLKFQCVDE